MFSKGKVHALDEKIALFSSKGLYFVFHSSLQTVYHSGAWSL